MPKVSLPRFTPEDYQRAYREWKCNCGPTALAAVTGMTLDEVRPLMGDFRAKPYTNPTQMWSILNCIEGLEWRKLRSPEAWPRYGLALIQFEGPWTEPGAFYLAACRNTHWVGVDASNPDDIGIYDCNAMGNGTGWVSSNDWERFILPFILEECVPKASGGWHIKCAAEFLSAPFM